MVEPWEEGTVLAVNEDVSFPEHALNFLSLDEEVSSQLLDRILLVVITCKVDLTVRALAQLFDLFEVFNLDLSVCDL